MTDGSVRPISYAMGQVSAGNTTLMEALASRADAELVPGDF